VFGVHGASVENHRQVGQAWIAIRYLISQVSVACLDLTYMWLWSVTIGLRVMTVGEVRGQVLVPVQPLLQSVKQINSAFFSFMFMEHKTEHKTHYTT
jgi:hypothetical protein